MIAFTRSPSLQRSVTSHQRVSKRHLWIEFPDKIDIILKMRLLFLIEKNKIQTFRLQDVMYSLVIMYSEDLFTDMK